MLASPKGSDFIVHLDDRFLYDSVKKRYEDYFNQKNFLFQNLNDYISATIVGISFPGLDASSSNTQTKGKDNESFQYRSGIPSKQKANKKIRITFQLKKGFLNWFVLNDQLSQYNDNINEPQVTNDVGNDTFLPSISVFILDNDGSILFERIFKNIVFESMDDITLQKSDNKVSKKEFTATFAYSDWNIKYNINDLNVTRPEYNY